VTADTAMLILLNEDNILLASYSSTSA